MAEFQSGDMFAQRRSDSIMADSNLPDPAFEPQADFMFGEGEDEYSNMQRNLDTINGLHSHHGQQGIAHMNGVDASNMPHHFNPPFNMNSFTFDNGDMSPNAPWTQGASSFDLQPQSTQADIVNNRGVSVAHHFGQITPPDDDPSKTLRAPSQPARSTPPTQAMSAKSERARNAANQRHAKAKKARKESVRKAESPDEEDDDDDVDDKRERYREKNRLAAAKCRAKKKVNTEDLEESARIVTAQNNRLKAEERELRDLFSSLRDQALAHDPSQGCNCQSIHAYNMNKAHQAARATMGFIPGAIPSPSQRSIDSGSPSTVGATSRTQSFSAARPQFGRHPARSQSQVAKMGYLPSTSTGDLMRHVSTGGDLGQSNYVTAPTMSQGGEPSPVTSVEVEGYPEYLQPSSEDQ